MKFHALIAVAAFTCASAAVAMADERLSDGRYVEAERCAAYQTAMPAAGVDADALVADLRVQRRQRPEHLREEAATEAREIARAARRLADDADRAAFAAARDAACGAVETWASAAGNRG